MNAIEQKIIVAMMKEIGAPYIWAGKGDFIWTAKGPLLNTITEPHSGLLIHGFDCCGIFAWGCVQAGLKDRRMTHNVASFMNELTPVPSAASLEAQPLIAIYGTDNVNPSHMAVLVSVYGEIWALQAAGGDHTTDTVEKARARGGRVMFGPVNRRDFICCRRFPTT